MHEYLIWSEEHGAWWRPARCGYTRSMKEAGRYSLKDAEEVTIAANLGETFCEVPVRVSLAIQHACAMPSGGR